MSNEERVKTFRMWRRLVELFPDTFRISITQDRYGYHTKLKVYEVSPFSDTLYSWQVKETLPSWMPRQ